MTTGTGSTPPRIRRPRGVGGLVRLVVATLSAICAIALPGSGAAHAAQPGYLDGVVPVTSSAGFTHPGVFLDLPMLEAVREKVAVGAEPQASVYAYLTGPAQRSLIELQIQWGPYSDAVDPSQPCDPRSTHGCIMDAGYRGAGRTKTDLAKRSMSAEINSAYANALLYYYSGGEEVYAQNAIRTLNGYGRTLRGFTSTADNGYAGDLFAAWMSETLVRAAEIIRYTYTPSAGATAFDVDAFESMLRVAFVPRLIDGTAHVNNWRTSAAEGLLNIGVFLDDRGLYDTALSLWREVTPAYIYLSSDGPRPASLLKGTDAERDCSWIHNFSDSCKTSPKTAPGLVYQNGQDQEICRDMWHAAAGVGGIVNAAETARIQGDDLYAEQQTRIMTGLSYMLELSQRVGTEGYPADFCAGAGAYVGAGHSGNPFPTSWNSTGPLSVVVADNHYATRRGLTFPAVGIPGYPDPAAGADPVAEFIAAHRDGPTDVWGFVTAWQVLTHYGVGDGVTAPGTGAAPAPTGSGSGAPDGEVPAPRWPPVGLVVGGATLLAVLLLGLGLVLAVVRRRRTGG